MDKEERDYSFDLLKIILAFFVSINHILNIGNVLGASTSSIQWSFYGLMCLSVSCAVNGFGLVSGYVSNGTKLRIDKIINCLFVTFFYSAIFTFILRKLGIGHTLSSDEIYNCLTPIKSTYFWYISAYFPLLFLMPFINKGLDSLSEKDAKILFYILIFVFSIGTIPNNDWLDKGFFFFMVASSICFRKII